MWLRSLALAATLVALAGASWSQTDSAARPEAQQVLLLSDLHFDPTADKTQVKQLMASPAKEWAAILSQSQRVSMPAYGQDSNWWLMASALSYMRSTMPKPALVIITGDFLAHHLEDKFKAAAGTDDDEAYRDFIRKTMEFVAGELRRSFPGVAILCTLGNNDNFGEDYALEPRGHFLAATEPVVRELAAGSVDADFAQSWAALGSFSAHPALFPKLRVISLNTNFLSAKYKAKAPADQPGNEVLDWLDGQLKATEAAGERAWLMFHIPPGVDGFATNRACGGQQPCQDVVMMWRPAYQKRFQSILAAHPGVVRASLAGHTHMDDFRLVGDGQFVLLTPAISPSNSQNPSFRKLLASPDGSLLDAETYYLNLASSPEISFPAWLPEYSFRAAWSAGQIDGETLETAYKAAADTPDGQKKWVQQYSVQHLTRGDMSPQTFLALHCADGTIDPAAYQACSR